MKRALIANIFGIGDVLFTTPLAKNLKKRFSGISVDYLVNARTKEAAECVPGVGDVFVYEKDDFVKSWDSSKKRFFSEAFGLFNSIRMKRYDAVFDLTMSRKFSFFFMLAGIPERVGLDYRGRGLFLTKKKKFGGFASRHVIDFYLNLLGLVGAGPVSFYAPEVIPRPEALRHAEGYLKDKGFSGGALAFVIPGGGASWGPSASRKRWPAKDFAAVADIVAGKGAAMAVTGDGSEKGLCAEVAGRMRRPPLFIENELSLKNYMALLAKGDLAICNDGGALHLASSLGVPTVSVFGPVDERVYGPYPPSEKHRVFAAKGLSCRPCYDRFRLPACRFDNKCLTEIKPEEVAEACLEILRHGNG